MALTGTWKNRASVQSGALKWGTGWNPVHAVHDGGRGRNIAPGAASTSTADVIPTEYTGYVGVDDYAGQDAYGYVAEDMSIWGHGPHDGTDDRPTMDVTTPEFRGNTDLLREGDWPSWDETGEHIRGQVHGAPVSRRAKQRPTETVSEGWENKRFVELPEDALTADESQLLMQTSMVQRDKVLMGSQSSGRASEQSAPIPSRIVGMRLKFFSGERRHYDMQPRRQDAIVRGWWSRTAGTGDPEMMRANDQRARTPIQRAVPAEPDQGAQTAAVPDSTYGYTSEDVIPYA